MREARDFSARLTELGRSGRKVLYDPNGSAEAIAQIVEQAGGTIVEGTDPVALPKAKKTAAELAGSRAAHVRDGVAMLRFLRFIEASRARFADRNRCGEEAGKCPRGNRRGRRHPARRHILRVDLVHRPERRNQPLSRDGEDKPAAGERRALPYRFRRAISRRHDRRNPHRPHRHASARTAAISSATASRAC